MQRFLYKNIIDIKYLLEIVLKKNQTWIWSNADYILNNNQVIKLEELIKKRKKGVPIAYLSGSKYFYNLDFIVNKHTLIPRPETENIIDIVKGLNLAQQKPYKILDLGTGSGVIAITLKDLFPNWEVVAVDNNYQALEIAKKNALKHNTKIDFILSNWFENITTKFDIIISNPPYIKENDKHLADLSDPLYSLVAQDFGMADIKSIIQQAPKFLTKNGYLLLEHGYDQQAEILKLLGSFNNIKTFNDLNSQNRNILMQLC